MQNNPLLLAWRAGCTIFNTYFNLFKVGITSYLDNTYGGERRGIDINRNVYDLKLNTLFSKRAGRPGRPGRTTIERWVGLVLENPVDGPMGDIRHTPVDIIAVKVKDDSIVIYCSYNEEPGLSNDEEINEWLTNLVGHLTVLCDRGYIKWEDLSKTKFIYDNAESINE